MSQRPLLEHLSTIALLGTERRSIDLPTVEGSLGELLAGLDLEVQERALLGAAAALGVHQRAGVQPISIGDPPPPCDPDPLPRCAPAAAIHLIAMLEGAQISLLPEWLESASAKGFRVPEEFLPALLERGVKNRDLRELLPSVVGKRGAWLARQNRDWGYLGGDLNESEWTTGDRASRLALLRMLRLSDPAHARDLLASTWNEETAEDREVFLVTFIDGLTTEDEAFLEEALGDRRKDVRSGAVELLASLPESALVRRITELAEPLLQLKKGSRSGLEVIPPDEYTAAMAHAGINKQPLYGMGEKAGWLMGILSLVPPSYWSRRFDRSASELIGLVKKNEWKEAIITGWSTSAVRQKDEAWGEALLDAALDKKIQVDIAFAIQALSERRREEILIAILRGDRSFSYEHPAFTILLSVSRPWSQKLSSEILRRMKQLVGNSKEQAPWRWIPLFETAALAMPSALYREIWALSQQVASDDNYWKEMFEKMSATLQFRHEMLAALEPLSGASVEKFHGTSLRLTTND